MEEFRIETPADLGTLSPLIHDEFFCVSAVEFDPASSSLVFAFAREDWTQKRRAGGRLLKSFEVPRLACTLTFHNVIDHHLGDEQGIDCYDFSELSYDSGSGKTIVATNIPNDVWVKMSPLDVHLVVTDRIIGRRKFRSLFG